MCAPTQGDFMNETPLNVEPVSESRAVSVAFPSLAPKVTHVLIGFTLFIYVLQFLSTSNFGVDRNGLGFLESYGSCCITAAISAGQLWRFITPVFLHGSLLHIFFNMYALFSIGSFLEKQFGHGRFALLYFLGGFSGNVFSFLFTNGYSIGASTAVFGLIAAEVIFFYQNRKLFGGQARQAISNAVFIIAVNLFIGLSPGIDNWGHVGGLLGGAMFAWFSSPRWKVVGSSSDLSLQDQREIRDIVLGAGLVIIIFGMLAAWGMF